VSESELRGRIGMKDFLKGLLALPFVVIGVAVVCWIGAIVIAVVGGVIALVVAVLPYVLRFAAIILMFVLVVWGLGKFISGIQKAVKGGADAS